MLKIKKIAIKDVGPIRDLVLDFNPFFNIICGTNGTGKTTILECIAHSFSQTGSSDILKPNVNAEKHFGEWLLSVEGQNYNKTKAYGLNLNTDTKIPENIIALLKQNLPPTNFLNYIVRHNENTSLILGSKGITPELIVFKTHRTFKYQELKGITKDPVKDNNKISEDSIKGIDFTSIKKWFLNRYLWSGHRNKLNAEQLHNLEKAKESFSLLDPSVKFYDVAPETNDILVETPTGIINFENLSAGYKSALAIPLGLIVEIEYRFKKPQIKVQDFEGIILIDEIDLHLHAEFQVKIYNAIKEIIPKAQVITTTHSPHLIQVASPQELTVLEIDYKNNGIKKKCLDNNISYSGWSLEDILTHVMGLKDTRTPEYRRKIKQFDSCIDKQDIEGAEAAYYALAKILNPEDNLKKLLRIQLAGIGGKVNDQINQTSCS